MPGPRHARPITRDNLITRYARIRGLTFGRAHDLTEGLDDEQLRETVERGERDEALVGRHASFRRGSEDFTGGIKR